MGLKQLSLSFCSIPSEEHSPGFVIYEKIQRISCAENLECVRYNSKYFSFLFYINR